MADEHIIKIQSELGGTKPKSSLVEGTPTEQGPIGNLTNAIKQLTASEAFGSKAEDFRLRLTSAIEKVPLIAQAHQERVMALLEGAAERRNAGATAEGVGTSLGTGGGSAGVVGATAATRAVGVGSAVSGTTAATTAVGASGGTGGTATAAGAIMAVLSPLGTLALVAASLVVAFGALATVATLLEELFTSLADDWEGLSGAMEASRALADVRVMQERIRTAPQIEDEVVMVNQINAALREEVVDFKVQLIEILGPFTVVLLSLAKVAVAGINVIITPVSLIAESITTILMWVKRVARKFLGDAEISQQADPLQFEAAAVLSGKIRTEVTPFGQRDLSRSPVPNTPPSGRDDWSIFPPFMD